MNLFDRVKAAASIMTGGTVTVAMEDGIKELLDFLGIDRDSKPEAMSEAVYFACLKVLSEGVGKLPLKIQQVRQGQGVRVAREHKWYRTLNERPNRHMAASVFWTTMELCRNHYGNAYAWIDTRNPARPQLWPLDPDNVKVWYDDSMQLSDAPDVYYQVKTKRETLVIPSEDVLHFKSHNTLNGLVGISVRDQLAETIRGNITAQKFINRLYESGMTAKAVLQYTGGLNDANVAALKKGMEEYIRGEMKKGLENVIPVPVGMSLTPLNLKLADSQFLEIKQFTALQIASAFGVKPYQVGDYTKSSYASAEAQQLSFLVDTLLFIVKQYEEEIGWKILNDAEEAEGYHVKFNTAVILRADQQTQIQTLSEAVSNFLMTPNEARERLDLPAKEGGDQLLGNGASIPVQYTGSQYTDISERKEEDKAWLITTINMAVTEALKAFRE